MQFFKTPLNYGENRNTDQKIIDKRESQYSTTANITCDIRTILSTGDAQSLTHIFLKTKNLSSFTITPTPAFNTAPTLTIEDNNIDSSGDTKSKTVRGFRYDLFKIPLHNNVKQTAQQLVFAFTAVSGKTIEIYELMILNEVFSFEDRFTEWSLEYIDLSRTTENIYGRLRKIPRIGGLSYRRELEVNLRDLRYYNTKYIEKIKNFLIDNNRFVVIPEYTRFPDIAFEASVDNFSRTYISQWKGAGEDLSFRIREN